MIKNQGVFIGFSRKSNIFRSLFLLKKDRPEKRKVLNMGSLNLFLWIPEYTNIESFCLCALDKKGVLSMKKIIAIVGDAQVDDDKKYRLAFETGKLLAENGYRIQSGGLKGVMNAAFAGAKSAKNYVEGTTLAIVPSFDRSGANDNADIVVATGLDLYRNLIVANADAVVAIGGGAGTLSEIASAWAMKHLVVAFDNVDGWSAKVAGKPLDHRVRYPDIPDDKVFAVSSAEEAVAIINERIDRYTARYTGIRD